MIRCKVNEGTVGQPFCIQSLKDLACKEQMCLRWSKQKTVFKKKKKEDSLSPNFWTAS